MSRYVLLPCRLRDGKLVPEKESEGITMSWRELVVKLAPSNRVEALKTLQHLQRGAFVGLLDQGDSRPPSNFCFVAQDRSGNVGEVLRRNPSFSRRLKEVYQVIEVERDSGMMESGITHNNGV
jgi:hypothetical protein